MLVKSYGNDPNPERQFSPPLLLSEEVRVIKGTPNRATISTSIVERQTAPTRLRSLPASPVRQQSPRVRSARMTAGNRLQPRLVLLCGLPASGKTTLARELADAYGAVRLNPDEWESALDIDPFDEGFQAKLEAAFWELAQRLLVLGTSVVLEWGFWARSERDEKREAARTLGVAVELRFLDAPYEELVRRVVARRAAGGIGITVSHMERYRGIFQPPTDDELALYDPPLLIA
jgi:predicted kinase